MEPEIQVSAICATANGLQMGNKLELEADFCLWNKTGQDATHAFTLIVQISHLQNMRQRHTSPADTLTGAR